MHKGKNEIIVFDSDWTASLSTEFIDHALFDGMMPIMNVFNEWHSANTSKKIRAVKYSCAQAGKYLASKAPYGYVRKDDKNHTPIIAEEAARVVRRILERRAAADTACLQRRYRFGFIKNNKIRSA